MAYPSHQPGSDSLGFLLFLSLSPSLSLFTHTYSLFLSLSPLSLRNAAAAHHRRANHPGSASCPIYCIERRAILPSLPPPCTVSITHFASGFFMPAVSLWFYQPWRASLILLQITLISLYWRYKIREEGKGRAKLKFSSTATNYITRSNVILSDRKREREREREMVVRFCCRST
mgnify:CR=1 FL=1